MIEVNLSEFLETEELKIIKDKDNTDPVIYGKIIDTIVSMESETDDITVYIPDGNNTLSYYPKAKKKIIYEGSGMYGTFLKTSNEKLMKSIEIHYANICADLKLGEQHMCKDIIITGCDVANLNIDVGTSTVRIKFIDCTFTGNTTINGGMVIINRCATEGDKAKIKLSNVSTCVLNDLTCETLTEINITDTDVNNLMSENVSFVINGKSNVSNLKDALIYRRETMQADFKVLDTKANAILYVPTGINITDIDLSFTITTDSGYGGGSNPTTSIIKQNTAPWLIKATMMAETPLIFSYEFFRLINHTKTEHRIYNFETGVPVRMF